MTDTERISQLEAVIKGFIPHFQMLLNQTQAQELLLYELIRLAPTEPIQKLLDTLQQEASMQSASVPAYTSAAELLSIALNGEPPKKNMRDILKILNGGKSDS